MKKILWCGGSHAGNAKGPIGAIFPDFENTFYITAGPTNLRWSRDGGRYSVKGSIVGANGRSPSEFHDLADYDRIVFIGHWIQPQRFMKGPAPLSDAVLDEMFPEADFLINSPTKIYNEVLEVFPRLAPGRCVLLCDPLSNMLELTQVPVRAKVRFLEKAAEFCAARRIGFVSQPETTLNTKMVTKRKFNRRDGDFIHMNDRFWKSYLKKVRDYMDGQGANP
ncbi:hypothetical protein GB928_002705 [Shinella curvata]|uniref:GDSL-like lipase/acylhydrolase family protein n=1 Tax=Shinella curvata TaxID=1817964 RepID=A0ABT8X8N0_9HYPH|nr:hypothetical protein [Shinella curvata]MCJ8051962.1 hypothetical protein [Shinella curvata]MDO6120090.1 hypothetical protein [Shinella curvata]